MKEMRILIVSCVFPPEPIVSAKTSAEIAGYLSNEGNDVTVITSFPNRPGGRLYAGYHRKLWLRENSSNNMTVVRCYAALPGKSTFLRRFIENVSFGITSAMASLIVRKPDVIFSNTWPIFSSGLLYLIARLRKIPLLISIQDIYPESLVVQKRLHPKSFIVRLLHDIDRAIAKRCKALIVICDRFADIYKKDGVSANKIYVVPNWGNPKTIISEKSAPLSLRKKLNIPEQAFLCIYAGNIGRASGVETCIEAFRYLRSQKDIHLVIAGEGSQLKVCEMMAREISNNRIKFYSPWPTHETATILSSADCLLLPTQGQQSLTSVPSKMISYMFAEKPIVSLSLHCAETARIIKQAGCGIVLPPETPEQLADAIIELWALPRDMRSRMGRSGKTFALNHFSSNVCLPRIRSIIKASV